MAKLTRKQAAELRGILAAAKRAQAYVLKPNLIIARTDNMATTTLHFKLPDGRYAFQVEKVIGSDMCGLFSTVRGLEDFLARESAG